MEYHVACTFNIYRSRLINQTRGNNNIIRYRVGHKPGIGELYRYPKYIRLSYKRLIRTAVVCNYTSEAAVVGACTLPGTVAPSCVCTRVLCKLYRILLGGTTVGQLVGNATFIIGV